MEEIMMVLNGLYTREMTQALITGSEKEGKSLSLFFNSQIPVVSSGGQVKCVTLTAAHTRMVSDPTHDTSYGARQVPIPQVRQTVNANICIRFNSRDPEQTEILDSPMLVRLMMRYYPHALTTQQLIAKTAKELEDKRIEHTARLEMAIRENTKKRTIQKLVINLNSLTEIVKDTIMETNKLDDCDIGLIRKSDFLFELLQKIITYHSNDVMRNVAFPDPKQP